MADDSETHHPLVRRISFGDTAAFAELYDRLIPRTTFVCVSRHCTPAQTEAVLYTVWMAAWIEATEISANPVPVADQLVFRTELAILEYRTTSEEHATAEHTRSRVDPPERSREHQTNQAFIAVTGAVAVAVADQFDVVDLLATLVDECSELLPIDAVGLLLVNSAGELKLSASTSAKDEFLEIMQLAATQGPCVDCFISGSQISVTDIDASGAHWPAFRAAALRHGFLSLHVTPLRFNGSTIGSLNFLGTVPGELTPTDTDLIQALVDVALVGILDRRTHRDEQLICAQLRTTLDTRLLIEQAKGVLAQTQKISLDDALSIIRSYSRSQGLPADTVAQNIIDRSLPGARLSAAPLLLNLLENT